MCFFFIKTSNKDYIDADKYYKEHSQIVKKIKADKSQHVHSESEAMDFLSERGFEKTPISFDYTIKGDSYEKAREAIKNDEKHPIYETYYYTDSESVWLISVINGAITAYPESYNEDNNDRPEVILSEKESIMSYDVATNTYYETIPNGDVIKIIQVDRIDANLLEKIEDEDLSER